MEVSREKINRLMDEVREIHESPQNQARSKLWHVVTNDQWEPGLIRTLPVAQPDGKIPYVLEPGLTMWSEILGFDLQRYWLDPLTFATAQLEMKVYHAQHFADDTYIDKTFRLLYAMLLEGSVVGVPYGFTDEGYPWIDYTSPPINEEVDLASVPEVDFFASGVMPKVHHLYSGMVDLLDDDFLVKFPDWIMGPFGVACELRGFDRFLMDLVLDLPFAQRLLEIVSERRLTWQQQCDRFLGITRTCGLLGNDDVNCPTLSPSLYEDVLLPLETSLCQQYGRISYWHSCGNTTRLLDMIALIPHLDLFHCGPWTDIRSACEVMGNQGRAVEICLDPVDKVLGASPDVQRRCLQEAREQIPAGAMCYIKADSLEVTRDLPTELEAIDTWIAAARVVLG
jgi:hypothetical protein